jgi:hypothetical protein
MKTVALALWLTAVPVHSWYPTECCTANEDCKRIDPEDLSETQGGWMYLPQRLFVPKSKERPSQDRWPHICIFHGTVRCLFMLQGT